MNGTQATTPATAEPDPADAFGAISRGDLTVAAAFGNATLISSMQAISCLHVMPFQSSGYHTLPQDASSTARTLYFRRLPNASAAVDGSEASYHKVFISGYRVASPAKDIVICDLATAVTHIDPIAIDTGTPAESDDLVLAGWGLDGGTLGAGSRPNDVRLISDRTIDTVTLTGGKVGAIAWDGTNPGPNLFDSGGAVIREVDTDWCLTGVIVGIGVGVAIEQFEHDSSFQIPGLYSAGDHAAPALSAWRTSDDTFIDEQGPTSDFSAEATLQVQSVTGKGVDQASKAILVGFDVTGIPTPTAARLALTVSSCSVTGGAALRVRRIRRAGLTDVANYNTFDGTNNWGTAGANNTTTDVFTANQFNVAIAETAVPVAIELDDDELLAMVLDARADDGVLRLLIEQPVVLGEGETGVTAFYSAEAGIPGNRPRLELDYVNSRHPSLPSLRSLPSLCRPD